MSVLGPNGKPVADGCGRLLSVKSYRLAGIEVKTDGDPAALVSRDPIAALIVAVSMELASRDEKISELEARLSALEDDDVDPETDR